MSNGTPLTDETLAAEAAAGYYEGSPAGAVGPPPIPGKHHHHHQQQQQQQQPITPQHRPVVQPAYHQPIRNHHPKPPAVYQHKTSSPLKSKTAVKKKPINPHKKKLNPVSIGHRLPKKLPAVKPSGHKQFHIFNLPQHTHHNNELSAAKPTTKMIFNTHIFKPKHPEGRKSFHKKPTVKSPSNTNNPPKSLQKQPFLSHPSLRIPTPHSPGPPPSPHNLPLAPLKPHSTPECEYPVGGGSYTCISFGSPKSPIFAYHTIWGTHGVILGTGRGFPGALPAEHVIGSGSSPFPVTSRPVRNVDSVRRMDDLPPDLMGSYTKSIESFTRLENDVKTKVRYESDYKTKLRQYILELEQGINELEKDLLEIQRERGRKVTTPNVNNDSRILGAKHVRSVLPSIKKSLQPSLSTIFVTPQPDFSKV